MTDPSALLAAAGDMTWSIDGGVAVRLLAGAGLGGVVGLEREVSDQPAGLRTHIAVALGASLFGVISTLGFVEFDRARADTVLQADVTRVASQVVVGIGFLGAGLIFRQGDQVRNLTTAASLWTVAAIGLACGVGDVTSAAVATVVLLVGLIALRPLRTAVRRRWARRRATVQITLHPGADAGTVIDGLDDLDAGDDLETSQLEVRREDGRIVLSTAVESTPGARRRWIAALAHDDAVADVRER